MMRVMELFLQRRRSLTEYSFSPEPKYTRAKVLRVCTTVASVLFAHPRLRDKSKFAREKSFKR